ncbi:MAG: TatD family hydrolase [Thermoplasmatota archaeon]
MNSKEQDLSIKEFPILDNHAHLRETGDNVEAVKRFEKSGGTHLIISHLPYYDLRDWESKGYAPIFERTLDLAEKAEKETTVEMFVTLGPYPVDLVQLTDKINLDKGKKILMDGMELAAEYVEDGKAIAIGEMGRPHFDVSKNILDASNEIMKYGMELAADIGCPVVLHTETTTTEQCRELGEMAGSVGLDREKVVKHYSPPLTSMEKNHGLFPSILANESNIEEAIEENNRFLLETDYIDDPERPGAVLGIRNVPKKTLKMYRKGVLLEEDIWAIHKNNPEKIYDIEIEL